MSPTSHARFRREPPPDIVDTLSEALRRAEGDPSFRPAPLDRMLAAELVRRREQGAGGRATSRSTVPEQQPLRIPDRATAERASETLVLLLSLAVLVGATARDEDGVAWRR